MEGNQMKMREALEEIRDATHAWISVGGISARRTIEMVFDIACAALSAPQRNCDVGTAEEQTKRHLLYCKSCVCNLKLPYGCAECFARWAQTPYEEEGENDGR